jgi:hypothetical protein
MYQIAAIVVFLPKSEKVAPVRTKNNDLETS